MTGNSIFSMSSCGDIEKCNKKWIHIYHYTEIMDSVVFIFSVKLYQKYLNL